MAVQNLKSGGHVGSRIAVQRPARDAVLRPTGCDPGDADVIAVPRIDFGFLSFFQLQQYSLGPFHARALLGKRGESYTLKDFNLEGLREKRQRDRKDRQRDEPENQANEQAVHAAALLDFGVTLSEGLRSGP